MGIRGATRTRSWTFPAGLTSLVCVLLTFALPAPSGFVAFPLSTLLALVALRVSRTHEYSKLTRVGRTIAIAILLLGIYVYTTTGSFRATLRTDSPAYPRGGVASIQLNAGLQSAGYNLCGPALERRTNSGWRAVRLPPKLSPEDFFIVCTREMRGLPPLFAARGQGDIPLGLRAGTYRFVVTIETNRSRTVVASNALKVMN